jgi:hypothetical protein
MDTHPGLLPEPLARPLLEQIAPGSAFVSIQPVIGDYYNRLWYLDGRTATGQDLHLVVKVFRGDFDFCLLQARTEYQALRWLYQRRGPGGLPILTPEPVFLDETGALLGNPGVVTRFLPGSPVFDPPYPPDLGQQMARTLAGIHFYPTDDTARAFLLDVNREVLWWRPSGSIPAWMAADPDGQSIWVAIEWLLSRREATTPRLCHTDFWSGNVLCQEDKITAVLDWGEAGYGDPGTDVGYGYMNLLLSGLDRDAEEFLATYESVTGGPVANLTLWKLAAAARPIYLPKGWIDCSPVCERFRRFVQETLEELSRMGEEAVSNGATQERRR